MADSGTQTPLRVTMLRGDCLEVMPTLAAESVALVFADLPYGVTGCEWDTLIDLNEFWANVRRLASISHTAALTATFPFALKLHVSNAQMFRYDLIWLRKRATGFFRAKKAPLRHHEHVLIFANPDACYNPIMTPGKKNHTTTKTQKGTIFGTQRVNLTGLRSSMRYPQSSIIVDESDLRYDALNGRKPGRLHPTQKPIGLLDWLIKTYSNAGDTVLDPVSGSATTAIASIRNGRNVVCIEKNATYFAAGVERVKAEIAASGVAVDLVIHD